MSLSHGSPFLGDMRYAIKEFVQKYPSVGLYVCLGEALEKDLSFWMDDVILAGIKDSGKHPPVMLRNWFLGEAGLSILRGAKSHYDNLYSEMKHNCGMYAVPEPDPDNARWAQQSGKHIVSLHLMGNLKPFRWAPPFFIQETARDQQRMGAQGVQVYPLWPWYWPYSADSRKRGGAEYGLVVQLLRLIRQARAKNPPLTMREWVEQEQSPQRASRNPWTKIRKINEQLRKFDISPRVVVRKTSVYLGPRRRAVHETGSRFGWQWWHPKDFAARAAYTIIRLEERGISDSLRECKNCKRWLLARRRRQFFCSAKCRDEVYRKSKRGKRTRAKYMRRYRKRLTTYQNRFSKGHRLRPGPRR